MVDDVEEYQGLEGTGFHYVYALSRTSTTDDHDPYNLFYIGKGIRHRWKEHFKQTRDLMVREAAGERVEYSDTQEVIRQLYETHGPDLDPELHTYIVASLLPEPVTFDIESVLIKLLQQMGLRLTNQVSGHGHTKLLLPASEARRFMEAEDLAVPVISAKQLWQYLPGEVYGDRIVCVLVKGKSEDFEYWADAVTDSPGRFPGSLKAEQVEDSQRPPRRGWNPHQPWTDVEARERARHYWGVGLTTAQWLWTIAAEGRLQLLLGITDPRTSFTVARYGWKVTTETPWLDYGNSIGFTLGESFDELQHSWLGKCLRSEETGRQPLNASGIGYLELNE